LIEKILSSFSEKELVEWFQKQAYIALGFVLSQCAMMGIDSCPIGLIDANKYDEVLQLGEKGLHTTVVLMV
jgi:nitroreductase